LGCSNRIWTCPYYRWDEKGKIHCEGGVICFRERRTQTRYADRFCGGDWGRCTLARSLNLQYEEDET